MLFYLDNFLSADPRAAQRMAMERAARQAKRGGLGGRRPFPMPQQQGQKKKQERGLNENYGRELMELHTLGVDGGYTQKDVRKWRGVLPGGRLKSHAKIRNLNSMSGCTIRTRRSSSEKRFTTAEWATAKK